MSIPPTTGAPPTTPDPMDLTSGTPEPESKFREPGGRNNRY